MKNIKRFALWGIPTLVITLVLIYIIITPRLQIANAMKIIENDPQVNEVIEKFGLEVQEVDVQDNMAYIILDQKSKDSQVIITVDITAGTVGKIVTKNGETIYDIEDIDKYNEDKDAIKEKTDSKKIPFK